MEVLFDQGHHELIKPGSKRWETILSVISKLGATFNLWQNPFISRGIYKYDIVVIGDPENSYLSQFEIRTLVSYVEQGGGLFLLSEWGGDERVGSNLNELSQHFGIIFRNDVAKDPRNYSIKSVYPIIRNFNNHPITRGLDSFVYLHGCTLDCDYPAVPLAFLSDSAKPKNAPIMAGANLGKGRVVAIGDSSSFGDWQDLGYENDVNFVAFQNILEWLSGKGESIRESKSESAVALRSAATRLRTQRKFSESAEMYVEAYEQSLVEGKLKNAAHVLLSASECFAEIGDIRSSLRVLNLASVISQRHKWEGSLQKIPVIVRKLLWNIEKGKQGGGKVSNKELRYLKLLEDLLEEKDVKSKGKAFEDLSKYALSLVDGFNVTEVDSVSIDRSSEIDMRILNRSTDPILSHLGPTILVECKSSYKKVQAADVRNFSQKLAEKNVKTGILVALNGITGNPKRADSAFGSIKNSRQMGHLIILLDGRDLYEVISGIDPIEIILRRYDEIFAL